MNFALDEEQEELRSLARRILSDRATNERTGEVERASLDGGDGIDHPLYDELAAAGLLAAPLGEAHGGAGLGLCGAAVLVEEVGRAAAAVPVLETLVLGALPIERFGSEALRRAVLPGVADGSAVVTAALVEDLGDPRLPHATATALGDGGYVLDGVKSCVPAGLVARRVLVPARLADGSTAVFALDPAAAGVTIERQDTAVRRPEARLVLDGVAVGADDLLGAEAPGEVLNWLLERATAGYCVAAAGLCDAALRLTADYVKTREQFGRVLASFQAVGQRAADAYIDGVAVELTAWQAIWRLSVGLPATDEVAIAKYWASEGSQRVVHACHHLHGGVGVDRAYPLHRYFLLSKYVELALGGAAPQLAELGRRIAAAN